MDSKKQKARDRVHKFRQKQRLVNPIENKEKATQAFIESLSSNLVQHLREKEVDVSIQELVRTILLGVNSIVEYHLLDIKNDIVQVQDKLDKTCYDTLPANTILNLHTFQEKYNIIIPVETMQAFENLERILDDDEVCKDFELSLFSVYTRSGSLSKRLTSILRALLTREIALKFTAIRKVEGKEIFRPKKLCQCIEDFLCKRTLDEQKPPLSKAIFDKALSDVLPNAKDWDGMRHKRKEVMIKQEVAEDDYDEFIG